MRDPLEGLGQVVDVVVGLVALAEHAEPLGQSQLGVADFGDRQAELHGAWTSVSAACPS